MPSTTIDNINSLQEKQFAEVIELIQQHKCRASVAVNNETLFTAWSVGKYVSDKLKSEEWGSKVVSQLSEYIRTRRPDMKGFSRSSIYNMVMFYEEYSSEAFQKVIGRYIPTTLSLDNNIGYWNYSSTQDYERNKQTSEIVQTTSGQFPKVLCLTTLSNHYDILCRCRSFEERLFYILYAHKENLKNKELQRAISTQTYETLLRSKNNMSKGLLDAYPNSPVMFKDTYFVDFLNLPKKHSESKLKHGLIEHMKQFILELGKDFIFMDQEYSLNVGASTFKADLLFFHRGLQALVAVELKKTKFHPRDLGQLEFYLEALDRDVKRTNENPSIGIILCPDADKVVVEYAMSRSMSPTMVAEYKRILIPQEQMQQQLREFCQFFLTEDKPKKK
ncbi:MAG TPA: hypothetical protein DD401_06645 [Prevotella sp.]|nr:hypothetical protein [Prevotella sp.]